MSSLRAFRFQKSKKANGSEVDGEGAETENGHRRVCSGSVTLCDESETAAFTADTDESQSQDIIVGGKPVRLTGSLTNLNALFTGLSFFV